MRDDGEGGAVSPTGAARSSGPSVAPVDYGALFAAIPTPYLVMDRHLVVVEANPAYLASVGRTRAELLGQPVFAVFPEPEGDDATGSGQVAQVRASFERARDTRRADVLPLLKYDIPDVATGGFSERWWSLIAVPVLDRRGEVVLVAQRAEDVTEFVQERARGQAERQQGAAWHRQLQAVESDLYARAQELRSALDAKAATGRRLAALAVVALELTAAESVEDLTATVFRSGLPALGAAGGAVAVRHEGSAVLSLTTTADYSSLTELPLDGPSPASVAARGMLVLVPDLAAARDVPGLGETSAATGASAWAALPLRVGPRLLGSLTVGWPTPQTFVAEDVELLRAFAAQCAQALDRLQVRQAERAALARSQRMSETLQRSLLTPPPKSDELEIAVRYQPASSAALVGGDWYDAFVMPDGSTSLVIGDVAGHDRDAAAVMGQVRNVLRGVAMTLDAPPAAVLGALDRALRRLDLDVLATVALARVARQGTGWLLEWASAGHPPPLVVRAGGAVELLDDEPDTLLGIAADSERRDRATALGPGDLVLLYTDGLVERRGESLDDGLARLCRAATDLAEAGTAGAEEWCDRLVARFAVDPDDDVALLALRVRVPGRALGPSA